MTWRGLLQAARYGFLLGAITAAVGALTIVWMCRDFDLEGRMELIAVMSELTAQTTVADVQKAVSGQSRLRVYEQGGALVVATGSQCDAKKLAAPQGL